MKIIFAGTPEFAVPCLEALLNSQHQVIAVYTQPDRPAGRGQKLTASPIKQLALMQNIPVYQPATLRDLHEQQRLAQLEADLMIVVAYGLILPAAVLQIPHFGCINVHASLLPRWRGAAPIQRAILSGDVETGITIMQMDEGLDTGAMLKHAHCNIEAIDTSATLQTKLANLGAEILLQILPEIAAATTEPKIQNQNLACYADKIQKQEAKIDWHVPALELDRKIRAFNPWPIAFTTLQNQIIKIWQAEPILEINSVLPGTIINSNKNGIDVATGEGIIRIKQLQLPNGRCLPVADVLNSRADWFAPGVKLGD